MKARPIHRLTSKTHCLDTPRIILGENLKPRRQTLGRQIEVLALGEVRKITVRPIPYLTRETFDNSGFPLEESLISAAAGSHQGEIDRERMMPSQCENRFVANTSRELSTALKFGSAY